MKETREDARERGSFDNRTMYAMLPCWIIWCLAPLFETATVRPVCLAAAAAGLLICLGKDFYDERKSNPWRTRRSNRAENSPLPPYERQMIKKDRRGLWVKIAVAAMIALQIIAGSLSMILTERPMKAACAATLLLPCCGYALWLALPAFVSMIPPEQDFTGSGFGLIFGRERAALWLSFLLPPFACMDWELLRYGAFTTLAVRKLLLFSLAAAAIIAGLFFYRKKDSSPSVGICAVGIAASLLYGFVLVRGLNVYLDFSAGRTDACRIVDTHEPDDPYDVNLHRDYFLTVEYEDGRQLTLYAPTDLYLAVEKGDTVHVTLHDGALDIAWAEYSFRS